jgi:16S rRNA (cytosine1402-N4)-methyltransferase
VHYSVLLKESVDLLNIKPDGIYIDGTFGRGGHSRFILDQLGEHGLLIAFDKDIEAISYAKETITDKRFIIIHDSFANLKKHLEQHNIQKIDGVLLDLGVSSPQIDTASRGFSFRYDSELDMRMDTSKGISCKEWLNTVKEEELSNILWHYGEERFSRKIAHNIVAQREKEPILTTTQLTKIIEDTVTFREKSQHPATRSFQAIRIVINNELGDLESVLEDIPDLLKVGGRAVIISFHSLEDRIVKTKFNQLSKPRELPKWVLVTDDVLNYKVIAKKIKASIAEIDENSRSRSAVLRALERVR